MWKRFAIVLLMILLSVVSSCGPVYKDGTYTGKSSVYKADTSGKINGYGKVTITVREGIIKDCTFYTYKEDGTLKDENYGKTESGLYNEIDYKKAQNAVKACGRYAYELGSTGTLKDIDAISGATLSYNQFLEAAKEALKKAKSNYKEDIIDTDLVGLK